MALYKRKKTWWTDFSVNGQRYRHSLETTDWREAQRQEKKLIAQSQAGKITQPGRALARMAFSVAIERFLSLRLSRLARKTIQTERERSKPLISYFGARTVQSITTDDVLCYIAHRKRAGISNATINRERDLVRGLLVKAQRWHVLDTEELRPLKVEVGIGKALSLAEKLRLLKVAESKPEWQIARLAATLALNTTMRGGEIRGLRWRDIDVLNKTLTVRRSKTEAGKRVIPLNEDAWAVVLELRERTKLLFGLEPTADWYVFPHAEGLRYPDPTLPMSGWRTAWRNLTRIIQCAACSKWQKPAEVCSNEECKADLSKIESPTAGLRFHDLRHHAITELAEGQASDQTIRSIAGHVSQKMLEHYSHIRLDAKRAALDALSQRGAKKGYGTNNDTNGSQKGIADPQVIEKIGGREGIRTPGLLVANEALSQLSYSPTSSNKILADAPSLAN
jgi:integrase